MKKRILCILLIVVNLMFIIGTTIVNKKYYNNVYRTGIFARLGVYAIVLAGICLNNKHSWFNNQKIKVQSILITILCIFTVTSYTVFFVFLPPYTAQDAYTMIKADPRYISENIIENEAVCITEKHGNPFAGYGYIFYYEESGDAKGKIFFNPVSGSYEFVKNDN